MTNRKWTIEETQICRQALIEWKGSNFYKLADELMIKLPDRTQDAIVCKLGKIRKEQLND